MQVFRRLQRLLICLSLQRSIATVDRLGKGHDAEVHEWRQKLEQFMIEPQVDSVFYHVHITCIHNHYLGLIENGRKCYSSRC